MSVVLIFPSHSRQKMNEYVPKCQTVPFHPEDWITSIHVYLRCLADMKADRKEG